VKFLQKKENVCIVCQSYFVFLQKNLLQDENDMKREGGKMVTPAHEAKPTHQIYNNFKTHEKNKTLDARYAACMQPRISHNDIV